MGTPVHLFVYFSRLPYRLIIYHFLVVRQEPFLCLVILIWLRGNYLLSLAGRTIIIHSYFHSLANFVYFNS